jgi:hypothetical protein
MSKFYHKIFIYCFLIIGLSKINPLAAMEQHHRPQVAHTPTKPTEGYGGKVKNDFHKAVRVSSCVSLGGDCISRINSILQNADEFIISFMYRFDSPTLIRTLENKYLNTKTPVLVFLDYNQTYNSHLKDSKYFNYVKHLINSVPTSLVKLGSRSFHHKVTISKEIGKEAIVIVGSANATYESDNQHSEDVIFIQSNELAKFYLDEFKTLLRYDPSQNKGQLRDSQVKIFHEHRLDPHESNINILSNLSNSLQKQTDNELTLTPFHLGKIKTVALSTGHSTAKGTEKCLNIVLDILKDTSNNVALLLFENYITLNPALKERVWPFLTTKTPKFIVVEDNKHNRDPEPEPEKIYKNKKKNKKTNNEILLSTHEKEEGIEKTKSLYNEVLFCRPFTEQKFHHKLILQYLKQGEPIIYSGSFHISSSAITNNSETIIGIQSQGLADEILASLLLNSGLGEKAEIWKFIAKHLLIKNPTSSQSQKNLLHAAHQLLLKTHKNKMRYMDRFEKICEELLEAASDADEQDLIRNHFAPLMEAFKTGSHYEIQFKEIENIIETVFKDHHIYPIWSEYINKLHQEILHKKGEDLKNSDFPIYSPPPHLLRHRWLKDLKEWLTWEIEWNKNADYNIKEELDAIKKLYYALYDLNEYEESFNKLNELEEALTNVVPSNLH